MEIIVEGPAVDAARLRAIENGARALNTDVPVIYTDDFAGEVRRLTMEYSYTDDRGSGTVAARTLTTTAGEVVVVANRKLLEERPPALTERVMAHECGHVLIARSGGEVIWSMVTDAEPDWWRRVLTYMTSNATDEHRAEAAVYKAGYPVEYDCTLNGIQGSLHHLDGAILSALYDPASADAGHLRDLVLASMDRITKVIACLAARHAHHSSFEASELLPGPRATWDELIAPQWELFLGYYRDVPSATEPWTGESALAHALATSHVTEALLRDVGFYSEGEDGAAFWVDLHDSTVRHRAERFAAEAERLGVK
ncbi:MAG: hypothetical protein QM711_03745 [Micropruina sp.]|uniref:hypothetical protein n=1 Tax=Micropruina sp. TaxID=2737536 RepID=UPI0039E71FE9